MGESVLEYMLIIITASLSVNNFFGKMYTDGSKLFFSYGKLHGRVTVSCLSSIEERLAFVVDTCINIDLHFNNIGIRSGLFFTDTCIVS